MVLCFVFMLFFVLIFYGLFLDYVCNFYVDYECNFLVVSIFFGVRMV